MYVAPTSQRAGRSLALDTELLLLRKRSGFTADRLDKLPIVLRLLASDEQPFEVVRERFVAAIRSLPFDQAELLLAVYGVGASTEGVPTLVERRAIYGRTIGRGVETVASLELFALAGLRAQLVTSWYPDSQPSSSSWVQHGGLVHESVSIQMTVRDGRWIETREHYRFVAASDGIEHLTIRSSPLGRPIVTGNFAVQSNLDGDSVSLEFRPAAPMRRGHIYDLKLRMVPDVDFADPGLVTVVSRAFSEPARYADFRVDFDGVKPALAWWFDAHPRDAEPGQPEEGRRLAVRGRSVGAQFQDLPAGPFHGVAWGW